jgi:CheY-like chemotaxis protein
MLQRPGVKILLVEDDDGHARLIERNLRKVNPVNPIDRVADGQEAIDYLHNAGRLSRPTSGSIRCR